MIRRQMPVHGITPEQLEALNKWAADLTKAMPEMTRMAQTAKAIHRDMVNAPKWQIAQGDPVAGAPKVMEDMWSIGAPKINYVDHIDRPGDSDGSPGKTRRDQR